MKSNRSQMHMIHDRDATEAIRMHPIHDKVDYYLHFRSSFIAGESAVSYFLLGKGQKLLHPEADCFLQRYELAFLPVFLDPFLVRIMYGRINKDPVSRSFRSVVFLLRAYSDPFPSRAASLGDNTYSAASRDASTYPPSHHMPPLPDT